MFCQFSKNIATDSVFIKMGVTKVPLKILNDPFDRTPSPLFVQRLWCFWYIRFWNLFEYRWIRKTFQNPVQNLKNEEWMFWNWESFKILFPDSDHLLYRDLFCMTHIIWVIYISSNMEFQMAFWYWIEMTLMHVTLSHELT